MWATRLSERAGPGERGCGRGVSVLGRSGTGRGARVWRKWAERVEPAGPDWAEGFAGFCFPFLFYFLFFSFLNLIQTKFEFKYGFEFKPHSNKSMHQHECNTKFKPMVKF